MATHSRLHEGDNEEPIRGGWFPGMGEPVREASEWSARFEVGGRKPGHPERDEA